VLILDVPTTGLADDVAASVRQLARDAAADGAAVLWLDQDVATAPAEPGWRLDGGSLIPVRAAGSAPPSRH
jgi:ABC-type branched-subunit amino acid transport system ATPase component